MLKQKWLIGHGIEPERGVYHFLLDQNTAAHMQITDTALWQFARVFVADDLALLDRPEVARKARGFLVQRLQLLQRAYGELTQPAVDAPPLQQFIYRLKVSERELLRRHEEKFAQLAPEEP